MELVAQAQALAIEAKSLDDLRCAQAVLLPAMLDASLEDTAAALGIGRATVHRLQARLRRRLTNPTQADAAWGGRRRASMSIEGERKFLAPWAKQCVDGGVLVVAPMRAALAQELGHAVAASVVYRLLARHGWRKVAPDTRHPKSDPAVQEAWKKTPKSSGGPAEARGCSWPPGTTDVSGRGPLRADGQNPPVLGTCPSAPSRVQWLRAPVRVCLWRSQPARGPARLDDRRQDEYRQHESVPQTGQQETSQRIHRHGGRWSEFACVQRPRGARKYSSTAPTTLLA